MNMLARVLISLCFLYSFFSISVAQPILNWKKIYDYRHMQEGPNQVIVDDSGNIYIIGEVEISQNPATNMDALIIKYDPYGNLLWYRTHSMDSWGWDAYLRAILTEEGNIFVSGYMQVGNTARMLNIMYSSDGDTLWSDSPYFNKNKYYNFEDIYNNNKIWPPIKRYIFKQDSIFIVTDVIIENNLLKLVFIKYNKEGQNLGMSYSPLYEGNIVFMDILDNSILFTYEKRNSEFKYHSVIQKLNLSGQLEWETEISDTILSIFPIISIFSTDGSIYSTSSGTDGDTVKYYLTKLNNKGKIIWDSSFAFEHNYNGGPADMIISDSGTIKLIGTSSYWDGNTSQAGVFIAKYDTSGNLLEFIRHPLSYVIQNFAAPKYDTLGNVYWSFGIQNTMGYLDILMTKINQVGQLEYKFVYSHNNNQTYFEEPMDMFVIDEDNYVICARGSGLAEASNILTLRYGSTYTTTDSNTFQTVTSYNLDQNYPNPFNPSTKINYTVAGLSKVSLKVYDILGREIMTLVNEEKPAGKYEVNLNAINIASGVYFYQLKAGEFIQSKKMLLIK